MGPIYDVAVVKGRFRLVQKGHDGLFSTAAEIAKRIIVVVESAFHARDFRNPFLWDEAVAMIKASVTPEVAARMEFIPVRDYYSNKLWAKAVRRAVGQRTDPSDRIVLVGHKTDQASEDLNFFPEWEAVSAPVLEGVDASSLRSILFESGNLDLAFDRIKPHVEPGVLSWLQTWTKGPNYLPRVKEHRDILDYRKRWPGPRYKTADVLMTCRGRVLMIRRGSTIGYGQWALPGGFLEEGEDAYEAVLRELLEETGLSLPRSVLDAAFKGAKEFKDPLRSPRGQIETTVLEFDLGDQELPFVCAAKDENGYQEALEVDWKLIAELPDLEGLMFEDHFAIEGHHGLLECFNELMD